jgi:hypothetical protein
MANTFSGRCLCGAVAYECTAAAVVMGNCHCRDCQRATGSGYAPGLLVPRSAVQIHGEVRYFEVVGDSGSPISRGFCPICGSRLFGQSATSPELISIMAGTLDDPTRFHPQADIYTSSAQPWVAMNPRLPKFEKMHTTRGARKTAPAHGRSSST